MGLGKTLQVLAFLVSLFEQQQQQAGTDTDTNTGPHLIIMPLSVMTSWRRDLQQHIPAEVLDVHVHLGSRQEREEAFIAWVRRAREQRRRDWDRNRDRDSDRPAKLFLCLTSYNFAINDIDLFRRLRPKQVTARTGGGGVCWEYLVVDEAHRLKNSESKLFSCLLQLKSQRHLLLSGACYDRYHTT